MTTAVEPRPPEAAPSAALRQYTELLGDSEMGELRGLAERLKGKHTLMVNSTAVGGGVAELLNRLVPLATELGVSIRWDVITGGTDFFETTKAFHNALQGGDYQARSGDFETFRAYNEQNRVRLNLDADFIVIHDPQPSALIDAAQPGSGHWVWRCHIDLSHPNPIVWKFLEKYVHRYHGAIFSSPDFAQKLPIPQYLFFPTIDPLSDKNRELSPEFIGEVLGRYHIDPARPILVQISRFDRWKDPVGVIRTYQIVKKYFDCQLVLAGGGAGDDPESGAVLAEVREAGGNDPDIHILELPPRSPLEVNALQRGATVVIQKSLREGFGLTVTEALWKRKPVVASAVGGIPIQIIHKHTGLLAHSVEGAAYQVRILLGHPEFANRLGQQGHQHVREQFLITGSLRKYLTLFLYLLGR